nr:MDIS1-interacting receptor like kinase 2-like [Coffea arabica]
MYREILKATGVDYGSVYKPMLPPHNLVPVQKLHLLPEKVYFNSFLNELRGLTNIKHRNIAKLHGFCSSSKHTFLVYEYLKRGSLAKIFSIDEQAKELDWEKRVNIIKGVAQALSYMHHDCSPSIVQQDVSSNNVLLDLEYEARVSDFGTAKFPAEGLMQLDYSCWHIGIHCSRGSTPGEFVAHLMSSTTTGDIELKDLLDQRLSHPTQEIEKILTGNDDDNLLGRDGVEV